MRKLFKALLCASLLFTGFVMSSTKAKANEEVLPCAVVVQREFSQSDKQTFTYGTDKIEVTMKVTGSYLVTNGSSVSGIQVTPKLTTKVTGSSWNLNAKVYKVTKTVDGVGYEITVNVDVYTGTTYRGGLEFKFNV